MRTSVCGLVCVKIDCKVSFRLCSKVCKDRRGFLCKASNSPRTALCLFERTGRGACRSPLVLSNVETRHCLIKLVTIGGMLVTVYAAIVLSNDWFERL
jgi:hypothetical protein